MKRQVKSNKRSLISRWAFTCWIACFLVVVASIPAGGARRETIFSSPRQHSLTIHFRHRVGSRDLKLFDETYTNSFGEPMTITRFSYYVSHLRVTGVDHRQWPLSDKTYLIDEADSSSKTLILPFSGGAIQSISFEIGVDSILNVSGVQTGDLDPLKGMFWTWNSGYIFAKLEGRSDSSHAPAHYLNWDIGGFKSPANASRKIVIVVPVQSTTASVMVIDADLLKWFEGQHLLKIAQHPLCHQPGELAMQVADNYSSMFSIEP